MTDESICIKDGLRKVEKRKTALKKKKRDGENKPAHLLP